MGCECLRAVETEPQTELPVPVLRPEAPRPGSQGRLLPSPPSCLWSWVLLGSRPPGLAGSGLSSSQEPGPRPQGPRSRRTPSSRDAWHLRWSYFRLRSHSELPGQREFGGPHSTRQRVKARLSPCPQSLCSVAASPAPSWQEQRYGPPALRLGPRPPALSSRLPQNPQPSCSASGSSLLGGGAHTSRLAGRLQFRC